MKVRESRPQVRDGWVGKGRGGDDVGAGGFGWWVELRAAESILKWRIYGKEENIFL